MSVTIVSFLVICSTLNAAAGDDVKPKMDQPVPRKPTENERKLTQLLHYAPPVYTKKQKNKCSLEDSASRAASRTLENLVANMAKNQNIIETDNVILAQAQAEKNAAHENIAENGRRIAALRVEIEEQRALVVAAEEAEAAATGQSPPLSDSMADIEQQTDPNAEDLDAATKASEAASAAAAAAEAADESGSADAQEPGFTGDGNVEGGPNKATSQNEDGTDEGATAAIAGPLSDDANAGPLSDDVSGGDDSEENTTDDKSSGFRPMATFLLLAPLLAFL